MDWFSRGSQGRAVASFGVYHPEQSSPHFWMHCYFHRGALIEISDIRFEFPVSESPWPQLDGFRHDLQLHVIGGRTGLPTTWAVFHRGARGA